MIKKEKINDWVKIFLGHVNEITPEIHARDEEGYKFQAVDNFQRNFNIEAPDLVQMLERSIVNNNLVAGIGYFPRKVLLNFATRFPEETRQILRDFFNQSRSVGERLNNAQKAFEDLLLRWNKETGEESRYTYIGLRFLSLLLGFCYPNDSNAIKPREWKVFCSYLDPEFGIPNHTPSGRQYEIFYDYIEQLRLVIREIPEIKALKDQLTAGLKFQDKEFRWMAQNLIYVTSRVLAKKKAAELTGELEQPDFEIPLTEETPTTTKGVMEFALEKHLEDFIMRNWTNLSMGERPLAIFIDEDGTTGQQYTTDIGIIDILAKDDNGDFVVIELKRGEANQAVIGQILSYVTWVKNNLATNGQKVNGVIIASGANPALISACEAVKDIVKIKYYRAGLEFIEPA